MADLRDPDEIETDDPDDFQQEADEGTDAGQIDDDGGLEAEAGQESQTAPSQERVSRRDDRIREELRAEREHRARVEFELQQLRQEREARQRYPQEETEEQFQARISLLDPEQRVDAKLARATQLNQRMVAISTFNNADRADKAAFDAKAMYEPLYKKYAQEVEQVLALERRKGRDFDRETVLDFVVGRARRLNQPKVVQARQQGQRNIERQQARTTGGRSDSQAQPRQRRFAPGDMSPEAVRARLNADDAFI